MKFDLTKAIFILERTPSSLISLLQDLPADWTQTNEGENSWSPYDIIGHLIHGEKTDWISRLNIVLSDGKHKTFEPFDRFAQFNDSKGKSLNDLLVNFKELRKQNIMILKKLNLTEEDYPKTGIHPELGSVTLSQLLASWVAHDLGHIAQITRVMAKQYKDEVGPWKEYLSVLHK